MSTNKITTLAQLKSSLQASKAYIDQQDAALSAQIAEVVEDIEGIVATGGEANILEGVKVNGSALAISDKMVDILITAGAENGTISVNGVAVAIAGLASLAYKSEITEDELGTALKASIAAKATKADLDALTVRVGDIEAAGYQTAEQVQAAIAASGHAHFETTESNPLSEGFEAEENVMYLYMNTETNHYDVYALVDGTVERINDTTISLDGYVTDEELTAALEGLGGGALYEGTKTSLDATDGSVIEAYFTEHSAITPKQGDVFVVTTIVGSKEYAKSAYSYTGEDWEAMTGNVDADKVIMSENLMLAGDYDRIGNWTKDKNGTLNKEVAGKSVLAVLKEITSKTLQPTITAQPSIPSFSLTGAGPVEAGTTVNPASYSGASLNAGSYKYGPATGVVASNWKVERITNAGTVEVANVDAATLTAGTDDNGGNGFIIGDQGGDNVVSSLKYRATATHGAGVQAKDNIGGNSNPAVAIAAGTKTKETSAYTPFRNIFYGATANKPTLDSAYIRGLTKSGNAYSARTFKIEVDAGTQRVAIACISGKTGVTKIINESAMNADVTATFNKSTVEVEGANGYTAVEYNVWVFEPAKPYENSATLAVTLG